MEALNVGCEIRDVSPDIYGALDTVWHPILLSKLCAYGIQGQLHTWLTDFLYSRSQHVALIGNISFPLHIETGVPQGSLGPSLVPHLHQRSFQFLGKSFYLFSDGSTLCCDIRSSSNMPAAASSISVDLDRITSWSNVLEYVFQS